MLRVYGYYAVTVGEVHDPLSAGDEGFFVGEGDLVSCLERADGGGQAGEADYAVEDDVGRRSGQAFGGARAGEDFGFEAVQRARVR